VTRVIDLKPPLVPRRLTALLRQLGGLLILAVMVGVPLGVIITVIHFVVKWW
jgi:hypothetical protein